MKTISILKTFASLRFQNLLASKEPIILSKRFKHRENYNENDKANLNTLYDWSIAWLDKFAGKELNSEERESLLKYLLPSGLFAKDARPHLYKDMQFKPEKAIYIKNGVPLYPAYYMQAPKFQDHLYKALSIHSLPIDNKYSRLNICFKFDLDRFIKEVDETIPQKDLQSFITILSAIYARKDSARFSEYLKSYNTTTSETPIKSVQIDDSTKFCAMGRRKSSLADVELSPGTGIITINNRTLENYFYNQMCRECVIAPFHEIHNHKFDVNAQVIGGGHSGQAAAIKMGISLCLSQMSSEYAEILNRAGLNKQDFRTIERKKYGRHKARKRYTWVAR